MTPTQWLLSNDTGISSETICTVMLGEEHSHPDYPHDPSDFGRCYRLLSHFPEWKDRLQEVADRYPIWGPLVSEWDELTELYLEELPSNRAPKLYARMKELIDEGRLATGWVKKNEYTWEMPDSKD